jgi:ATP-dependent RNA helicase RhlE
MPKEISDLASSILKDPARVAITPTTTTVDLTEQFLYYVEKHNKKHLLVHLLKNSAIESALVFSRTKHGADKLVEDLVKAGINAEAIHGNKSQSARQLTLNNFKAKKFNVLVATDIAARGIDVSELSHVINFDLPDVPETYVHRIGRTGRAGLSGIAISFCDDDELASLRDIQKLIGKRLPVVADHPYAADFSTNVTAKKPDFSRFRSPSAKSGNSRFRPKSGGAGRNPHSKKAPSGGRHHQGQ